MRNEERRLFGLVLCMLVLAAGQGCGSAGMDGELGPTGDPGSADPDAGDGPDQDHDDEPDPGATLPPPSDLRPELVMLGDQAEDPKLWAANPNDVFMAGDSGLLAHFDGARWRPFELEGATSLGSFRWIFGFESDDVYVGDSGGRVLHFDGESWQEVGALKRPSVIDLWGPASDDVYALTESGLMHFDGIEWSELAEGPPEGVAWSKITGSGEKHIVVIGRTGGPSPRTHFTYFDGVGWDEPNTPEVNRLNDVWSAGPNETFAVGRGGVILRFDGKTVTEMETGTDEHLLSVHGTPGGDVFAVGANAVLQLDGDEWRSIPLPPTASGDEYRYFSSVVALEGGRALVAGMGVYDFDGDSWETRLPYSEDVSDIWASGPDDVLFAGSQTHRYDGFTVEPEDFGGLDVQQLRAVWGTGDRMFAADSQKRFLRYDGQDWGALPGGSEKYINDMFGTSENDVFAVGREGTIMHFDGASWEDMASGTQTLLRGVWASAPDDVYAVGNAGTVLHYDGSQWVELFGSGGGDYSGVTGFDATQIVAPSSNDVVFFSDGISWRPEPVDGIRVVHGTSSENLYAAGDDGLSHYNGEVWTRVSPLHLGYAESVFAVGPREVYVATGIGVVRFAIASP